MGQNPVKAARERLGLTRTDVALKLGVSYYRVAAVELGHTPNIPPSWRAGLDALGVDPDALQAELKAWRASYAANQSNAPKQEGV